ncbi:hypothetical protein B0H19DRAFT_1169576 [Mycena capillaripes]|nr:hypothetical protein B0H19DRAFT_1169576 [Mycena capillaripes]
MPTLCQVLRESTQTFTGPAGPHRLLLYAILAASMGRNWNCRCPRQILASLGFAVALFAAHLIQRIFFTPLRPSKTEQLYDRLWFFVTESLLTLTLFRYEFDTTFAAMLVSLMVVKSFHWIAADQIEWMDQTPSPRPLLLFHVRMAALFLILCAADILLVMFAVDHTLRYGIVGSMLYFACEYAVLIFTIANTLSEYLFCAYALRRAGDGNAPARGTKSAWVFYIELVMNFLKLATYFVFFSMVIVFGFQLGPFLGIPWGIVYLIGRLLIVRIRSLHRYHTAHQNQQSNAAEEGMPSMEKSPRT